MPVILLVFGAVATCTGLILPKPMIEMSKAAINASSSSEDNGNYSCYPQAAFKEGKPSEGDLDELALKIAVKWQKVGRHLGICQDVLDEIEANQTEKPYRMLLRWRDTTTSNVLYEDLYRALCHPSVGLNNLAKEFCFVSAEGPSPAKRTKLKDSPPKQFLVWCVDELHEFYNTNSKVKTTPWDPDNTVDVDKIYIQLSMLRDDGKPHKTLKEKLEDYAEMFKGYGHHSYPKRILVYGKPGIGKSTFTQKIAVDWTRGRKEILKRFDVVLLIKLRDVCNSQDFRTMLESAELLSADNPIAFDNLDKYVRENQGKVLLVFDGYDEYNVGKSSPVNQIWRGRVLRGCCAIITTRRVKGAEELSKQSHVELELNGFDTEKQVKEFASKFLSDQKDVEELVEYLRKHDLWDMARIPLLLLMLCLVWKEKDRKGLPTSGADLYSRFMETLLYHLDSKDSEEQFQSIDEYTEELSRLGELAFNALLENCLHFSFSKLPDDGVFKKFIDSGFLQTSKLSSSIPEKIVYFLHETVQEYVAAKFIVQELTNKRNESVTCLSKVDSFQKIEEMFEVLKFACELLSDATCAVLSHLRMIGDKEGLTALTVEDLSYSRIRFMSICWDCLFSCAASGRQAVFPFFLKCVSNVVILNDPTSEKLTVLKNLLPFIRHPRYIEINGHRFMSYDAGLIEIMVANIHFSDKLNNLKLNNINLTSTCVNEIASSLHQTNNLHELDLSGNPLYSSVSDLVKYLDHVTVLRLRDVNMGEKEAAVLGASLASIHGLEELDISDNAMGHGIIELANHLHCVPSLAELNLLNTEMGVEEATAVSQCLPSINLLRNLDLSLNPLGYGIMELAKHLNFVPGLSNLYLADTQMDEEEVSALACALKDVPELFVLVLSDNPLGRGVSVLIQHLSSVPELEWLDLDRVEMTKIEAEELCTARGIRTTLLFTDYHVWENDSYRLRPEAELEQEGHAFADEKNIKWEAESNDGDDDDNEDDDDDDDDDDDYDDGDDDDDDDEHDDDDDDVVVVVDDDDDGNGDDDDEEED